MTITKILWSFMFVFLTTVSAQGSTAKESKKFFLFFDDGCEHPVESCEAKSQLPSGLKKKKDFSDSADYLGSIQKEFADKNEAGIDAYEHYFSDQKPCMQAIKKANCGN